MAMGSPAPPRLTPPQLTLYLDTPTPPPTWMASTAFLRSLRNMAQVYGGCTVAWVADAAAAEAAVTQRQPQKQRLLHLHVRHGFGSDSVSMPIVQQQQQQQQQNDNGAAGQFVNRVEQWLMRALSRHTIAEFGADYQQQQQQVHRVYWRIDSGAQQQQWDVGRQLREFLVDRHHGLTLLRFVVYDEEKTNRDGGGRDWQIIYMAPDAQANSRRLTRQQTLSLAAADVLRLVAQWIHE